VGGTLGYAVNYYLRDMGASAFVASMRVAVAEASYNFADAGFYFSGISFQGSSPDRANSIYINPDEIGFMNSGLTPDQTFTYSLNATAFHEYTIRYSTTHLMEVFVDAVFEDVVKNLASPVLSRQMFSDRSYPGYGDALNDWTNYQLGVISFGDMTNDWIPGVNSRYTLDFLKYENIGSLDPRPAMPPVSGIPEPTTLALIALGLVGLTATRRRKTT